jgi:hypothetical protein
MKGLKASEIALESFLVAFRSWLSDCRGYEFLRLKVIRDQFSFSWIIALPKKYLRITIIIDKG